MRAMLLLMVAIAGCGEKEAPAQTQLPMPDAAPIDTAAPASTVRTMKNVPLFGATSVDNLLIDPTFEDGDPGIGRWYVNAFTGGLPLDQTVTAASPMGMALAVGVVTGFPAGATSAKSISMMAQLPGGKGPYVVGLWATTAAPADLPLEKMIHVTIAQITATRGLDIAIDPTATRVIGGRTWVHFSGIALADGGKEIASFTLGAIMTIKMPSSKATFWLQAPEVVAKPPADVAGMNLVQNWRDLTLEERLEIEAVKKIPLAVGLPKVDKKPAL